MSDNEDQIDIASDNETLGHDEPMVYEVEEEDADSGELTLWTIYRMSATGRCLLELVAAKTGWPAASPPQFLQDAFTRGKNMEKAILDKYAKEYGVGLIDRQKQCEFILAPGIKLRGHIDARDMGSGNVVDAKFYRSDTVDKIVRDPEKYMPTYYLFQAAGYGASLGNVGMDFIFGKRNVKTNELGDIEVVSYSWEELKPYLGKIRVKVMKAEKIAREDLEWPLCDDAKIYPCPYHELRLGKGGKIEAKSGMKDASQVYTFDSSDTANLAETLWEEREVQAMAEKVAKTGKDELNKRLEYLMEQQVGEAASTQTWDINGKKVLRVLKESPLYDWKQIRKDIPEFDKKYKLEGQPVRFLQRGKGEV